MSFFQYVEHTGLSMWIRESDSLFSFWFILSVHAIGMGLLVGASVIIDFRLLGMARDLPISSLKKFYGFIWVGFWIQVISGLFLLVSYPTKALTNPDFYIKLTLIAIAMVVMQKLRTGVLNSSLDDMQIMSKGRSFAILSLVLWASAVTAGRLLAYTFNTLTAG